MARFGLKIYGRNDEITNEYETNIIPWAVYIRAAHLNGEMSKMDVTQQMQEVSEIMKSVFVGLSDDELNRADGNDVMNVFMQIVNGSGKIKTPKNG